MPLGFRPSDQGDPHRAAHDRPELERILENHYDDATRYVPPSLINDIHDGGRAIAIVIDDWHRMTSIETVGGHDLHVREPMPSRPGHHRDKVPSRSSAQPHACTRRDRLDRAHRNAFRLRGIQGLPRRRQRTRTERRRSEQPSKADRRVGRGVQLASCHYVDAAIAWTSSHVFRRPSGHPRKYGRNVLSALEPMILESSWLQPSP